MRERVMVTRTLRAPSGVWRLLTAGDRIERWLDLAVATVVVDAREGGLRKIRTKDGGFFDEHITLIDEPGHIYQVYAPDPPLPVRHIIATQRIVGNVLSWLIGFDVTSITPPDIASRLRGTYVAAMGRLDELAM